MFNGSRSVKEAPNPVTVVVGYRNSSATPCFACLAEWLGTVLIRRLVRERRFNSYSRHQILRGCIPSGGEPVERLILETCGFESLQPRHFLPLKCNGSAYKSSKLAGAGSNPARGARLFNRVKISGEIREASLSGVRVPKLTAVNEFGTQLVRFQLHTTQFNAQVVEYILYELKSSIL
jgi:hypothetical protein